jgi:putative sterol carrier protein
MRAIRERIESVSETEHEEIAQRWPAVTGLKIVVQAPGGKGDQLVWNVAAAAADDGLADAEPSDKLALFIANPATWMSVLSGESNPITAVTSGRLRCVNSREPHALGSDEIHALGALLGLTSMPVARHRAPVA